MNTLERTRPLALAILALLGMATFAFADDAWEARLLRQVEELQSKLKEFGEVVDPKGSIDQRVRSIERATAKLEQQVGVVPRAEKYYEGSSESQHLVVLTNAIVSLKRRLDALPTADQREERGTGAKGDDGSTVSALDVHAGAVLWGGQDAAEQAAQFTRSSEPALLISFVAAIRRQVEQGPPGAYLVEESRRAEVRAWIACLSGRDDVRAEQAALELGYSSRHEALPALVEVARHGRGRGLRSVAIDALVMLGYLDAVPSLIDLITDPDVRVGNRAAEAVAEILARAEGARSSTGPPTSSAGNERAARQRYFRSLFNRRQVELRRRAGQLPEADGSKAKRRPVSPEVLGTARAVLDAPSEPPAQINQRIQALDAVGRQELIYALRAEVRARREATAAAEAKPWGKSRESWLRVWLGRVRRPEGSLAAPAANELGNFASRAAVEALAWALSEHEDLHTRLVSALALGRTRSVDAIPPLIAALDDKSEYVRVSAYGALVEHAGYRPRDEGSLLASQANGRAVRRLYERWFRANESRLREADAKKQR